MNSFTYDKYLNKVNDKLHEFLDSKEGRIYDACRYSLYAGGKRIRPVLTLASCNALGGRENEALTLGCSLEMIHTYSLIHDDLPCMDNDDLRRGNPTSHKVFGEATAVLAGDAFLNMACETVVSADFDEKLTVKALRILFNASGCSGMIGGQMLDMEGETRPLSEEELVLLHQMKTGALINAAVSLGAVCADKDECILSEYSSALGLAFQIKDDILDVEGNSKILGKSTCSDLKNGKTTFVSLYGMDEAKKRLRDETEKALAAIEFLGSRGEFLKDMALYLLTRQN